MTNRRSSLACERCNYCVVLRAPPLPLPLPSTVIASVTKFPYVTPSTHCTIAKEWSSRGLAFSFVVENACKRLSKTWWIQ